MEFDVLIKGGLVYDGAGGPPRSEDIGLRGDRIEAVGRLAGASAAAELDATGLAVAPGFIDTHTHSDLACFLGPEQLAVESASVRQGVTTEICGNCGFTPFPCVPEHRSELERHMRALSPSQLQGWSDLASYSDDVRRAGLFANLAPLIGQGSLRVGVMGLDDRPPTALEMETMQRMTLDAFEQGAFGISTGLIYAPGMYASTEEIIAVVKAVAPFGRPYTSHIRGETDMVIDSIREALRIGREAGVPVHISHHKVAGRQNWGRITETLELIRKAREEGLDVTLDVYPYTAGSTLMHALLPPWVQSGGIPVMLERLHDGRVRERIRREFDAGPPNWENLQRAAGWDRIYISSCPGQGHFQGRSIAELAADAGLDEPDFFFELLIAEKATVTVVLHLMSEDDVRTVVRSEMAMIGSDGIPLPGKPHPRWAGSFTRILGHYSRELRLLDLPAALQKMTAVPAARFGLHDRGLLLSGKAADMVVFDPEVIVDRATYEEPLLGPDGVRAVIVNGRLVVDQGLLTGSRPGRVLS
jgi:N-acyl-D-amino-acid deacylase